LRHEGVHAAPLRHCNPGAGGGTVSPPSTALRAIPADEPAFLAPFASAEPGLLGRRSLLSRSDTKFALPAAMLPAIVGGLAAHYDVVRMPASPAPYRSLYFDTPELRC